MQQSTTTTTNNPNPQFGTTTTHLGLTRINVYSGLAGFYLITDPNDATDSISANSF